MIVKKEYSMLAAAVYGITGFGHIISLIGNAMSAYRSHRSA